jgi:hypothetical protein
MALLSTRKRRLVLMSQGYSTLNVKVGAEFVSFTGKELIHVPGAVSESVEEQRGQDFALYETPHEGRKLHVQDWRIKGSIERRPGESAAEIERTGTLYSEEEARQKYPVIFEELLRRSRI